MDEQKMISEREAVLREREAFAAAFKIATDALAMRRGDEIVRYCGRTIPEFAAERYPLPRITRPRVVLFEYAGAPRGNAVVRCVLCDQKMLRQNAVWHAKRHVAKDEAALRSDRRSDVVESRYRVASSPTETR